MRTIIKHCEKLFLYHFSFRLFPTITLGQPRDINFSKYISQMFFYPAIKVHKKSDRVLSESIHFIQNVWGCGIQSIRFWLWKSFNPKYVPFFCQSLIFCTITICKIWALVSGVRSWLMQTQWRCLNMFVCPFCILTSCKIWALVWRPNAKLGSISWPDTPPPPQIPCKLGCPKNPKSPNFGMLLTPVVFIG